MWPCKLQQEAGSAKTPALLKDWIRYDWSPLWVCLLFLSGFSEPALWWVGVCLRVIFGQHNPNWQWSSEPRRGADGENKLLADLSSLLQKCPYYCGRKVNFHFEVIYVQWCWHILCNPQCLVLFSLKWQLDKNNWSLSTYLQSPVL